MTCDLLQNKLDAYVDGSCTPEQRVAVEEHLQSCSSCAAAALGKMQMKQITRAATASRYTPSPEFRLRIENDIARTAGKTAIKESLKRRFAFNWMQGLAAATVALLLVAVSVLLWERNSQREQALAELLDLHVATLASANPVDVISTDRHTVKPWFQGKLPFTFNLPELGASSYKLLGGKLIYFNHNPGAQLLFELGKHQLSVFIFEDKAATIVGSTHVKGFSVESWSEGGLRYVVVSDASQPDVRALSDLLRTAAQQ